MKSSSYLGQFVVSRSKGPVCESVSVETPKQACEFWRQQVATSGVIHSDKEHVVVLLLSTKNILKGWSLVAMGTQDGVHFRNADLFRPVIVAGAHRFILMHNHPSGDPTPSEVDRRLTRKVRECSRDLDLEFIDHVIVGDDLPDYFSFAEHGLMEDSTQPIEQAPVCHTLRMRRERELQRAANIIPFVA